MIDDMIPCFASIGFFLILFGYLALMRYLRYRETLALAEKGLVRMERMAANGKDTLRWGIALTAVGLALSVGIYPVGFWIDPAGQLPLRFGPWMLVGLLPMFFGVGLILIYLITREEKPPADEIDAPPNPPSE